MTFLNREFALDGVRAGAGPEVVMEATWPTSPIVFRSADDGSYTYMLMPLNVDETDSAAAT